LLLGTGWRIPTYTEWNSVQTTLDPNGYIGYSAFFSSVLKLHAAGILAGGSLVFRGSNGYYWSSLPQNGGDGYAWGEYLASNHSDVGTEGAAYGFPLRCLRD
jgi:hypothetical protein